MRYSHSPFFISQEGTCKNAIGRKPNSKTEFKNAVKHYKNAGGLKCQKSKQETLKATRV
nr:MAG TPA: hypothetical protein [Bacteriophage sp.]